MADVMHISEEEAVKDTAGLFERVRAGEQVIVEAPGRRSVLMATNEPSWVTHSVARSQSNTKGRTAAEILDRLTRWESTHGVLAIDGGFADDVQVAHERLNQPMDSSKWG